MSEYIAKAPIEPRDYRVVFLTQSKTEEPHLNSSKSSPSVFKLLLVKSSILV